MLSGGTLSSDGTTARSLLNNLSIGGSVTLGNGTNNGTLTFNSIGVDTPSGINVTSNSTVTTNSNVVFANVLSGSGRLTKSGVASLTLSGSNGSYAGGLTLSAGTLVLDSQTALGTGQFNLNGGTVSASNTLNHTTLANVSQGG